MPTAPAAPGMPNVGDLLGGDPMYQQFLASLKAQAVQDQASRDAAMQRAMIMYGAKPDFSFGGSSTLTGDLPWDKQTKKLAAANTDAGLSTLARLDEANTQAIRGITNTLAARGIFRSGETGYQMGQEQKDYSRAQYDSAQKLLDYLSGVQSAFVQAQRANQAQQYSAQLTALQNWLALNPNAGLGGTVGFGAGGAGGHGAGAAAPHGSPAPVTQPGGHYAGGTPGGPVPATDPFGFEIPPIPHVPPGYFPYV